MLCTNYLWCVKMSTSLVKIKEKLATPDACYFTSVILSCLSSISNIVGVSLPFTLVTEADYINLH